MIFISIALDIMLKNNASERKPGGEGWGGKSLDLIRSTFSRTSLCGNLYNMDISPLWIVLIRIVRLVSETKIVWTPISVPLMLPCITEVPMYRKLVFQVCNLPGTDWHEESH